MRSGAGKVRDPVLRHQEEARAMLREGQHSPPAGAGGQQLQCQAGLPAPDPAGPPTLGPGSPAVPGPSCIKNSLARLQLQYAALASQLSSQHEQKEQQKNQGALGSAQGAPRLNQYPML